MLSGEASDVGCGKVIHSVNVNFLRRSGGVCGRIDAIAMALCRTEVVFSGLVGILETLIDCIYIGPVTKLTWCVIPSSIGPRSMSMSTSTSIFVDSKLGTIVRGRFV